MYRVSSLRTHAVPSCQGRSLRSVSTAALVAACAANLCAVNMQAAVPNRLRADASLVERAELPQPVSQRVTTATALGRLPGTTALSTMALELAPTPAQSTALDQLLAAQQNPASPSYHKWLTPQQFGAQFGVSDSDLAVLESWLTSQGFQVLGVAPSRNQIQFSGTAALAETAFGTTMGRFHRGSQNFFENSTSIKVPVAFQGVITGISGLSSFRMQPRGLRTQLKPDYNYNSASGVAHALVPFDVRQIYDASNLLSSGYNGTGVSIGIIGQSAVDTTQIADFQTLTGQTAKTPSLLLVPQTGTSTLYQGDEGESEADLEYAGGVAPGASLTFIYSGNTTNADVITALEYAITNNSAQILSLSYGGCEVYYSAAAPSIEQYLREAGAQGQTVLIASGDSGAAGCDGPSSTSAQDGLQVSYPASSPSVTAIGGTRLSDASSTNYWETSNNNQLGSAVGYIPEVAWNDTDPTGFSSSGGGASRIFGKPSWQTGPGVPADNARDIPDISFASSNAHDSYVWCTADTSVTASTTSGTVTGACTTAKLGSFLVGGTSLATPAFAGMLALVEQAHGGSGLGNINPLLYALANLPASSGFVFHDVTSGNNIVPCLTGTLNCTNGSLGYNAGPGYDLVTGLGSMDIDHFSSSLSVPGVQPASRTSNVALTVKSSTSTSTSTSTTFTAAVTPTESSAQPTGSINFSIDNGSPQTIALTPGGSSTFGNVADFTVTTSALAAGTHTLTASYSGDGNYAAASASLSFTAGPSTGAFSVAENPGTLTVISGQTANLALNFTSTSGFSGLLTYTIITATGSPTIDIGCFTGRNDLALAPNATASLPLVFHTSSADCQKPVQRIGVASSAAVTADPSSPDLRSRPGSTLLAFLAGGGLLGGIAVRRRKPWMTGLLAVACTATLAGLGGCGSGSAPLGTTVATTTAKGTYNLVVTATSATNSTQTTTSNFTIVVQ